MDDIETRVARGAALLDEHAPGWDAKVNLATLNIWSCEHCILGQVYGDYQLGIYAIDTKSQRFVDAIDYGFCPSAWANQDRRIMDQETRELNAAWRDLIGKRRVAFALERDRITTMIQRAREAVLR